MGQVTSGTYRTGTINLQANVIKSFNAGDTNPNMWHFVNNATNEKLYVSNSPALTNENYIVQILPSCDKKMVSPQGIQTIYLLCSETCNVQFDSVEGVVDLDDFSETADINIQQTASGALDVEKIMQPLPAGTNTIGKVDINSMPTITLQSNAGNIGAVDVESLPSLPAGSNSIGSVNVGTFPSLPAGSNHVGEVAVSSIPAVPAGTNHIGEVAVNTVSSIPAIPAGNNKIGSVDVATLPAVPAGTNNIGKVDVNSLPSLPAGINNIGSVNVNNLPNISLNSPTGLTTTTIYIPASTQVSISSTPVKVYQINSSHQWVGFEDTGITKWFGNFNGIYPISFNGNLHINNTTTTEQAVSIQYTPM